MAAYYSKFQKLSYDLDSGTIEDEMPISLLMQASEKDDLTWAGARVSGEFELFKKAAREEIASLEKKGSWVVVKRSSVKSNILPSTWALKRKRYPMDRFENIKCGFALERIDSGMVLIMRRLTHQWYNGQQ